jgi:hypothetical protein
VASTQARESGTSTANGKTLRLLFKLTFTSIEAHPESLLTTVLVTVKWKSSEEQSLSYGTSTGMFSQILRLGTEAVDKSCWPQGMLLATFVNSTSLRGKLHSLPVGVLTNVPSLKLLLVLSHMLGVLACDMSSSLHQSRSVLQESFESRAIHVFAPSAWIDSNSWFSSSCSSMNVFFTTTERCVMGRSGIVQ